MLKPLLLFIFTFSLASFARAGELAPPWQLTTQDGKPVSLAQYKNKPVILHFWATWCPYCKRLQPKLSELQKKYQASGIEILAVSFNEDEGAKPQDEIYARGYDFITAVNGEAVANLYGVRGTPTTFFIKRSGEVIYRSNSSDISNPKLELAVQEIIKN
ncbi:TlpA family protein disulfide reductase [Thalassomonas viridans]|uniref:TlpA family protein disulfide reductase n=1 Tax=Thalassomonas viridans TaxID=137584 RepID=A0AAE9Z5C1_9GAMM|nr:TlpA disulfide reductase family protein [Thalassomonas viridans]WDE06562.1 TlpA family protein disulfide reductase [Thalassomonas viridans]